MLGIPALVLFLVLLSPGGVVQHNMAVEDDATAQIVATSEKMIRAVEGLGDFSCETEIQYYRSGKEDKLFRFTFYWERKGITRVRFSRPYPGLTASHVRGDTMVILQPFPFLPFLKFRYPLSHALVRTPSGQRMDQASIEYLSRFFFENITSIQQKEHAFFDGADTVAFTFWANDYTAGQEINRYYLTVSKETFLPKRIERYNHFNIPIEVITLKEFKTATS